MKLKIENGSSPEILLSLTTKVHDWHVKNHPHNFKEKNEDDLLHYFRASLEKANFYHFVAYDDTKPIGFIQTENRSHKGSPFQHPQKLLYIHIIAVIPEYQRKGVGRKLFEKVIELAKSEKLARIELDYWEGNVAAEMFKSMGFQPYRHYIGLDIH